MKQGDVGKTMAPDVTPAWAEQYRPSLSARFLGGDELTHKTEWFLDQGDGTTKILTLMPVDEMLDMNATMRSLTANRRWDEGLALAARVPMHIWQRELAEAVKQEDKAYLSRWLNDPGHARFRTKEGKV